MTWLACAAACDGGGGSSDGGTGSGGPIVIAVTTHGAVESAETCGGCHVVIDEVREGQGVGEGDVHVVPDLREYLVHEQMMLARDLVAP